MSVAVGMITGVGTLVCATVSYVAASWPSPHRGRSTAPILEDDPDVEPDTTPSLPTLPPDTFWYDVMGIPLDIWCAAGTTRGFPPVVVHPPGVLANLITRRQCGEFRRPSPRPSLPERVVVPLPAAEFDQAQQSVGQLQQSMLGSAQSTEPTKFVVDGHTYASYLEAITDQIRRQHRAVEAAEVQLLDHDAFQARWVNPKARARAIRALSRPPTYKRPPIYESKPKSTEPLRNDYWNLPLWNHFAESQAVRQAILREASHVRETINDDEGD